MSPLTQVFRAQKSLRFVATDNYAVAKVQGAVAATLVEDGQPIIYVTGNQAQSTGQERMNGFMEAFAAARPNSEILQVPTEWNSQEAQEGVESHSQQPSGYRDGCKRMGRRHNGCESRS